MFHDLQPSVSERMRYLEQIDAKDQADGTPWYRRMLQVPPETGKFLALLASVAPLGTYIEIGTSGGYSSLWIATACERLGRTLNTFEISAEKAGLARQTFQAARVEKTVNLIEGDARHHLMEFDHIAFCFLDAGKEVYGDCYEAVVPRLVMGGLLVADNVISHQETLQPMLNRALTDERVDALIVPIGSGVLVCRKV